jgi:hypothetical protein
MDRDQGERVLAGAGNIVMLMADRFDDKDLVVQSEQTLQELC